MNEELEIITLREDKKELYIKYQYKGICTTCGKYRNKSEDLWHREDANVPKCHYCEKVIHTKQECYNRTREEKPRSNNEKGNKKKYNY